MPPRYAAQKGFTLLELIVAMTLAALIVALGANILRMGMDFYRRSHEYIRQQQEVRGFIKLLRDEVQGASRGTLMLSGESTRLDFVTDNIPVGVGRGGRNNVSLECRGVEQGRFDLVHRIWLHKAVEEKEGGGEIAKPSIDKAELPAPEIMPSEYEEEILVRQLSRCAFSFLLRKTKEGKTTAVWIDAWEKGRWFPLAIRVQLAPPAGDLPPMVIPIKWH